MNLSFFTYLIESSVYLMFFLVVYRFTIAHLTHFSYMRAYLLLSLILSAVLPFLSIPIHWTSSVVNRSIIVRSFPINVLNPLTELASVKMSPTQTLSRYSNLWEAFLILITFIYFIVVVYKTIGLIKNVNTILSNIKKNEKIKENAFWIIYADTKLPAYSFFNFIFINTKYKNLSTDDLSKIKTHEMIHAQQWHTFDVLLIELYSILYWFNPIIYYSKIKLQEIHEFIADEKTAGKGEMKKNYAQLLLNLATEAKSINLVTGFSGKQISKRISMISKRRSPSWSKMLFFTILPISLVLLTAFSYRDTSTIQNSKAADNPFADNLKPLKVREVKWINNSVISSAELDKVLGLKKGEIYNYGNESPDHDKLSDSVITFYLDKGYVFSHVEIVATPVNKDEVDLAIKIFEGNRGKIGTVKVTGNKTIPTDEIMEKISIKPGDLFSKTKIIESVRAIARISKIDPEEIKPQVIPENRIPLTEFYRINLVFDVTEK